jgi:hypothetical protein
MLAVLVGQGVVAYRDEQGTAVLSESEYPRGETARGRGARHAIQAASDALKEWLDAQEAVKKAQQSGNATAIQDAEKNGSRGEEAFDEARKKANPRRPRPHEGTELGGNTEPTGPDARMRPGAGRRPRTAPRVPRTDWKDAAAETPGRMKAARTPRSSSSTPTRAYTARDAGREWPWPRPTNDTAQRW